MMLLRLILKKEKAMVDMFLKKEKAMVDNGIVWRRFEEGCLIRVIHTFNINPGFGETKPATFASMGPNFE